MMWMERNDTSEKKKGTVTPQCENQEKETWYVAFPIYFIGDVLLNQILFSSPSDEEMSLQMINE